MEFEKRLMGLELNHCKMQEKISMNEINIYYLDDSELAEYEAISKGYRIDISSLKKVY